MTCSLERVSVVDMISIAYGWDSCRGGIAAVLMSPRDFCACKIVVQEHIEKRERDAAIEDRGGFRPCFECLEAGLDFWHHAAIDRSIGDQFAAFMFAEAGGERWGIS